MIYGKPPIHIDDDQTDRIGIRTLIMSQMWQASRWPMSQEELDAEAPAPPAVAGGVVFIGQQTRPIRGALRTYWTFEGINGNGKAPTFKDRNSSIDYRFNPGFADRSILLLKGIQDLMASHGGTPIDGQVIWQPTIPSGTSSGMTKNSDEGKPNPMFGRTSYLSMEGTYLFRYAALDFARAMSGVRKIYKTGALPGKPPTVEDRDWLKAPPSIIRRGPVHDIVEAYWLSDVGGWPKVLYGEGGAANQE